MGTRTPRSTGVPWSRSRSAPESPNDVFSNFCDSRRQIPPISTTLRPSNNRRASLTSAVGSGAIAAPEADGRVARNRSISRRTSPNPCGSSSRSGSSSITGTRSSRISLLLGAVPSATISSMVLISSCQSASVPLPSRIRSRCAPNPVDRRSRMLRSPPGLPVARIQLFRCGRAGRASGSGRPRRLPACTRLT